MRILITGSSGHLGEAIARTLVERKTDFVGIDILPSPYTTHIGSITDRDFVEKAMRGVDAVLHTATLHKPHVATHSMQDFVETNVSGTLALLEAAVAANVKSFIFTSTTSAFGDALTPPEDAPVAWITEDVRSIPKNIYGATKTAAEDLCQLFYCKFKLPCLVLRTSRFFPEDDDQKSVRAVYTNQNSKVNELLYRRADIADMVEAHLLAIEKAPEIGFDRYIISATTPFTVDDLAELRRDAPAVVKRIYPEYEEIFRVRDWQMFHSIDRVYVSEKARVELGWEPRYTFKNALELLKTNRETISELAEKVGAKGYHPIKFDDMPYPVDYFFK